MIGSQTVAAARISLTAIAAAEALAQTVVDSTSTSLATAWFEDATFDLHLRTYYFDSRAPGPKTQAAWAVGGWLAYQSGRWPFEAACNQTGTSTTDPWRVIANYAIPLR